MKVRFAVIPVLLSAMGWSTVPSPVRAHGDDCESQDNAVLACMNNASGVLAISDFYACDGCIDQLADAAGAERAQDECMAADSAACTALAECPCMGCTEEAIAVLECVINDDRLYSNSSSCVEASCESPGTPPAAAPAPSAAGPPALGGGGLLAVLWATCVYGAVFMDAGL
jgi:hypothetical protein